VKGDIFQGPGFAAINEITMTSRDSRNVDGAGRRPVRAIQTLPRGFPRPYNDFFAQFSVMARLSMMSALYRTASGTERPPPTPFHGSQVNKGPTLSLLTSETVEDVKLLTVA